MVLGNSVGSRAWHGSFRDRLLYMRGCLAMSRDGAAPKMRKSAMVECSTVRLATPEAPAFANGHPRCQPQLERSAEAGAMAARGLFPGLDQKKLVATY